MPQHSVRQWRENVEHDGHTDEDLPRGNIELIDLIDEPTDNEIVGQCKRDCGCNGVVCADVSDDRDFGCDFDVGAQESAKERCDRPTSPPIFDRMENQLVTAVGVFLPAGQFIIDGKRDSLFEATIVISCEPVGSPLV